MDRARGANNFFWLELGIILNKDIKAANELTHSLDASVRQKL